MRSSTGMCTVRAVTIIRVHEWRARNASDRIHVIAFTAQHYIRARNADPCARFLPLAALAISDRGLGVRIDRIRRIRACRIWPFSDPLCITGRRPGELQVPRVRSGMQ